VFEGVLAESEGQMKGAYRIDVVPIYGGGWRVVLSDGRETLRSEVVADSRELAIALSVFAGLIQETRNAGRRRLRLKEME
jgi:hypothetical protein